MDSISVSDERCPINSDFARLALLCIHSAGQRPYEIATLQNKNIDLFNKTLTITPDISKTENFHVVPLSEAAINIIKIQREKHPKSLFLFPAMNKYGHLTTCEFLKTIT